MKKTIQTNHAPQAIGPYAQAVQTGKLLFISGQIPIDPKTNLLIEGDIQTQTRQIFKNINAILKAANTSLENIIKITIFMTDLTYFTQVNEICAEILPQPFPTRSTVQVTALPKNAQIEIETIAEIP